MRGVAIVPAHNNQKALGRPLLRKNPSRPVIVAFGTRGFWRNSDRFYLDLTPVALPSAPWGVIVHGATALPQPPGRMPSLWKVATMSTRRRPLTLLTSFLVLAGVAWRFGGTASASPRPPQKTPRP